VWNNYVSHCPCVFAYSTYFVMAVQDLCVNKKTVVFCVGQTHINYSPSAHLETCCRQSLKQGCS
jgi:hypothetical protein